MEFTTDFVAKFVAHSSTAAPTNFDNLGRTCYNRADDKGIAALLSREVEGPAL